MGILCRQILLETRLFVRRKDDLFWTLAFPIFFMVLYGIIYGDTFWQDYGIRAIDYTIPGIMVMALMVTGIMATASGFAEEREKGLYRRLALTPLKRQTLLAGQIIHRYFVIVVQTLLLLLIGILAKASALKQKGITFTCGDASKLPFQGACFDCIGISFAFRNLTYNNLLLKEHLAEIIRVLKTGGRLVIVESSQPKSKLIRAIYHIYMRLFVYRIGWLISGNKAAYRYLTKSCREYYSSEVLREILMKAGFKKVSYTPLFFGVAGIYVASK